MTNTSPKYNDFVGIDIGKDHFELALAGQAKTHRYSNTQKGFTRCLTQHGQVFAQALIVIEATGGYEKALLNRLVDNGFWVHLAHAAKVKFFIRSYGGYAKTDAIDAKAIAQYGQERAHTLALQKPADQKLHTLNKLVKRRDELVNMRVQEKNRRKGPDRDLLKSSMQYMLDCLDQAIDDIEQQIADHIQKHQELRAKSKILQEIPGVGEKTACMLLSWLPELGQVTGKQIASLAAVAPHPVQSGSYDGYRKTRGGRTKVKSTLFISAMAASRTKTTLGTFYKKLLDQGKKPIVALVALMRKIIVIANAKIKHFNLSLTP